MDAWTKELAKREPEAANEITRGEALMSEASTKIEELRRDKVRLRTMLARIVHSAHKEHSHIEENMTCDLCADMIEAREVLKSTG